MNAESKNRILIVDDHEENREFLARRLERRGFEVAEAQDGPRALDRIDQEPFDLVLLDIMMPGMDGQEVLRRLRGRYAAVDLPVIMLTARDGSTDIIQSLREGANDYVSKPVDFEVLVARVQSHLEIRNAARVMDQKASGTDEMYRLEELQQSLFPIRLPQAEEFQFSYARVPCWKLAGDTLNIFRLDDLHIGACLLDVKGHSAESALFASTLCHLLSPEHTQNSIFWEQGPGPLSRPLPPGEAVARLQRNLPVDPEKNLRFALHYGVLDLSDSSYTYVSVGHPTPILLRPDHTTKVFPSDLGLLGDIAGEVLFHEHRVGILRPGEQLYLFSDGIDSLRDQEGLTEKPEKLVSILGQEEEDGSIKDRLANLVYLVGENVQGPIEDDITVIGMQRN